MEWLILPATTIPPASPTVRRHAPREATSARGYGAYRDCLRWEFAFCCPFCLSHERDLMAGRPIDGTGLMSIEHRQPRSSAAGRARVNDYRNCFLACRYCNGARGTTPVHANDGSRLLDPCVDAWGDHFQAADDRLHPQTNDGTYTEQTYDINEPRRVGMRAWRRELVAECLAVLTDAPLLHARLLERIEASMDTSAAPVTDLIDIARLLHERVKRARADLSKLRGVPSDAPSSCRCVPARVDVSGSVVADWVRIDVPTEG
jgi:5-methylcytosine-specific restriction endonuclease McrA